MRRWLVAFTLAVVTGSPGQAQPRPAADRDVVVRSPDGRLVATVAPATSTTVGPWHIRLERDEGGRRVELLGWSPIGVVRPDVALVDLRLVGATPEISVRDRYETPSGKRRAREHVATERRVTLEAAGGAQLVLTVRVADDGLAFRYTFPETTARSRRVTEERTGFAVPAGSRGWLLPFDAPGRWTPALRDILRRSRRRRRGPDAAGLGLSRAVQAACGPKSGVRSPQSAARSPQSGARSPQSGVLSMAADY